MTKTMTEHRWIICWEDGSDPDRVIRATADSPDEARDHIERILEGNTLTPEDADEIGGELSEPAYGALVRDEFGGDILSGLLDLRAERVEFCCDEGTLTVEKEF